MAVPVAGAGPGQAPDHHSTTTTPLLPPSPPTTRKVNRSCVECTRRKVKCDGRQPCGSCQYSRVAGAPRPCEYRQRSRRNAVSRRTFDRAADQLRAHSQVLETLFPGADAFHLADKTQAELLDLLRPQAAAPDNPHLQPPHEQQHLIRSPNGTSPGQRDDHGFPQPELSNNDGVDDDDSAPVSESGEPTAERKWDESLDQPATVASDDINAIGVATDEHARSYLGVTSMSAVLRAIFRLCPAAKERTAQCARALAATPAQALAGLTVLGRDPDLSIVREQRCIDFYFEHIHTITPLLDEDEFRRQYAAGTRQDGSWLGLLNMVFALGSLASGCESLHEQYYHQARSFTGLDSLGSGNMDSLQALCLLGGYYLHYRNSPNMAYGIIGAAYRMALALGLHREPRHGAQIADPVEAEAYRRRVETRRRTWWSLYCIDTWGCMTQGRPTCGRWDRSTMDTCLPSDLFPGDHAAVFLRANIEMCLICERTQHRFAQLGRPANHEITAFDAELQGWFEALPHGIRDDGFLPQRYLYSRELMKARYYNARIVLARALILYVANDCKRRPRDQPRPEYRPVLDACCRVSAEAVDAAARHWVPNRIQVWNWAWYLFQACTVPLLCVAVEGGVRPPALPPHDGLPAWQSSVAKALETFAEMRPWMRASDRSPDIVSAMHEALGSPDDDDADGLAARTPSATDGSLDLFGWYDEQLNEMDWGVFLGDENLASGMFPL